MGKRPRLGRDEWTAPGAQAALIKVNGPMALAVNAVAVPDSADPSLLPRLQLGPLAGVLGFHLAKASVTAFDLFERHIGQSHNLRKVDYSLLMLLLSNGPLPPKRLALALSVSAPKLTLLLDRLQARGLVRRQPSQLDRRSHNIVLTAAGQALAKVTADAAEPMERQLLRKLSVAEHAMLIELLQKVSSP